MALTELCKTKHIPAGGLREFSVGGKGILVAHVDGRFYCLAPVCTHAGAPLVKGVLKNDELECPWHDGAFRITDGSVLYGPPKMPLQTYQCLVRGESLFVDLSPSGTLSEVQ
jgi:nitrite reductase/ring-hydroxylating ferredoxin subunit